MEKKNVLKTGLQRKHKASLREALLHYASPPAFVAFQNSSNYFHNDDEIRDLQFFILPHAYPTMTIQFFGAAQTVTGSMHFISANGTRLLLDCGLYQGKRAEAYERNKNFPFDASAIDAVILSHAHIDHAGNLPNLVRNGFRGPIYATNATRDLSNVMLYDSAYIQEKDVEFVNKKRKKNHEAPFNPLYTIEDVKQTIAQFVGVGYKQRIHAGNGISFTHFDAGHILGSAVTVLEIEEWGKITRLGFTGDLGRKQMPILRDPEPMGDVDILISESTYGGKIHDSIVGMEKGLLEVITRTMERGGKIIVPAFSVGKTQEFVYSLFKLFDDGKLPPINIYVDSPLATNATEIFRLHPECFDEETSKYILEHEDPFGFSRLKYVRTVEESKKLNDLSGPCIIVASSGMCEGGRILHHLANNIENPKNTILIIGFMAEHTLGRRLIEKQPEVKIFGEPYKLRSEVAVFNSFSAHAGQDELSGYIGAMNKQTLKNIFLVHGEVPQAQKLSAKLHELGFHSVHIPARGEKGEFGQ